MTNQERLIRARTLARLMDSQFSFYGFKFGLDGLVGLIPGFGDTATGLVSAYIVWQGYQIGIRGQSLYRMIVNVVLDVLVGYIPILGDMFDFAFKANDRNFKIIENFIK